MVRRPFLQVASLFAAGALFFGAARYRAEQLDAAHESRQTWLALSDMVGSPGPATLQLASFQHPFAWSDLFWLTIVQEIGRAKTGSALRGAFMRRWADIATDLDPGYYTVYYATAVNLTAYLADDKGSDALLKKGRAHLPSVWTLPFLMGYNAYFIRSDVNEAADLWHQASLMPDCPSFLVSLAARARYQTGDEKAAIEVLEQMLPHLEGLTRQNAILRLKSFRSEPILKAYDEACTKYRDEHDGQIPTAETLRAEGYTNAPAKELLGGEVRIDDDCRARSEFITIREDEARKNIGNAGRAPDDYGVIHE